MNHDERVRFIDAAISHLWPPSLASEVGLAQTLTHLAADACPAALASALPRTPRPSMLPSPGRRLVGAHADAESDATPAQREKRLACSL